MALGLSQQSIVAVGGLKQFISWHDLHLVQRFIDGALTGGSVPWLDDLANKIHASLYWLQDGLGWIYVQTQVLHQPLLNFFLGGVEPLR